MHLVPYRDVLRQLIGYDVYLVWRRVLLRRNRSDNVVDV
jgi:hypothetical protein